MPSLYALVHTEEPEKKDLYIKGNYRIEEGTLLAMRKDDTADFATYFNSFSVKKWKRYTTIRDVTLELEVMGDFLVTIVQIFSGGRVREETFATEDGKFSHTFGTDNLSCDILGFSVRCVSDAGKIIRGGWRGEFDDWQEKRIGISITTFKRETYVKKTISVLRDIQKENDWLDILVVDNGRTLEPKDEKNFRIVHNRNFGGSGGFTRGMIEYVEKGSADYVLLMDDDIVLEPSAVLRTRSLLCGIKEEYKESFLAGAMFFMERPTVQHENTAHWKGCVTRIHHKDLDCIQVKCLAANETDSFHPNGYAGWWYCAIPVERIRAIGYPIPAFIKSDDMEYGIRNGREILSMNGIGVWHESFDQKLNPAMRLFSDRNSLILNHYAHGCGRMTFWLAVVLRVLKRGVHCDLRKISILAAALEEYWRGFEELTACPADEVLQAYQKPECQERGFCALWDIGLSTFRILRDYSKLDDAYREFREKKLRDAKFWKQYLGMRRDV